MLDEKVVDEIGLVVTYSGVRGPIKIFNQSQLTEQELVTLIYRVFTILMAGIDYRGQEQTRFGGTIEIQGSEFFAQGFYREVSGYPEEVQQDPRLKTTALVFLLVMQKPTMAFLLQRFLDFEEFLAAETRTWKHLTDVSETDLETLYKRIQEFMRKSMEAPLKDTKKSISISFLLRSVKKGLDKVIGAIIGGDTPVIVMGDQARVELAVATLEQFTPFKSRTITWTDRMVELETADLIGMPPTELVIPADRTVVLDLVRSRVIGGQSCKFAQKLLKGLEKLPESDALTMIDEKRGMISSTVTQCVKLTQKDQLDLNTFSTLIKNLDPQAVELFLKVCKKRSSIEYPTIVALYKQYEKDTETRFKDYLEEF